MTEKSYNKVREYYDKHSVLRKILIFLYKYVPLFVLISYPIMLIIIFFKNGLFSQEFYKVFFIPFGTFVVATIIRYIFNFQRPYEKYNISPIMKKDKKGQSFPSRHSVSIFIIAMAGLYLNIYTGTTFLLLGCAIASTRVLCGVHFIKDVVAGALFSIIIGSIFFFCI